CLPVVAVEPLHATALPPQQANTKILLATVKGDVHDIGKNIVGVVLQCNGYEVIDLGVMVPSATILDEAHKHNVDIIGLSGLITPSLDEMVHMAKEMQREGFTLPLLIGGATTSKVHTAVKVEPHYSGPVVHVLDASRSVAVVSNLMSDDGRDRFIREVAADYEQVRTAHANRQASKTYLSLDDARANRFTCDWSAAPITKPNVLGVQVFDDYPLAELRDYIDWTPFFIAWELKGKYPQIFNKPDVGGEAKKLYDDANRLLDRIIDEKLLTARGVVGLWPANSTGDDLECYTDDTRSEVRAVLHTLRQQAQKTPGHPNRALADFVAPKDSGVADYVGAFAVTAGVGLDELVAEFEADHDDYHAILAKALADRLAEAFAERLHERVRRDLWGYAPDEDLSNADLISETYRGIRPAPGYPACPDHTEKPLLWDLMDVEAATGIVLTEHLAMYPTAAVCGVYFAHPDAAYFDAGHFTRDQVADYAARKGLPLAEMERWLSPRLAYEPEAERVEAV
ncbi:MAG TPA: vitamin B12 dependent-methionine synthase activation domain-containing protein, partial [Rhodothermales bacterium]|nr:vitamin B12 dependent-methionine synthase activation domain-containing protein [Rhodothermales bacterium]